MILITDSHVSTTYKNINAFFGMLERIERTSHDVVFLGDIFDLWVCLPRYEEPIQQRFLAWCKHERQRRSVGLVEGNHEFFVANRKADHFSWCVGDEQREKNILFIHGDLINPKDKNYLRFRSISKNRFTRWTMHVLPWGPRLVHKLKSSLKNTNKEFRIGFPEQAIQTFARKHFGEGIQYIFGGHLHHEYTYQHQNGAKLHILPDWLSTEKVGIFDEKHRKLRLLNWQDL